MKTIALLLATLGLTPPLPAQEAVRGREAVDASWHNSIPAVAGNQDSPDSLRISSPPTPPRKFPGPAFSAGVPAEKSSCSEMKKLQMEKSQPEKFRPKNFAAEAFAAGKFPTEALPAAANPFRPRRSLAPATLLPAVRDFAGLSFFRPPASRHPAKRRPHRPLYRPVSPFGH